MWDINLVIILTFSIFMGLYSLFPLQFLLAQVDNIDLFNPNNNISTGTLSNTTGIMENTSGLLDDAFATLKESFGSFFGK